MRITIRQYYIIYGITNKHNVVEHYNMYSQHLSGSIGIHTLVTAS